MRDLLLSIIFTSLIILLVKACNADTAQQLPDKCIDALNIWVESLNEKEK